MGVSEQLIAFCDSLLGHNGLEATASDFEVVGRGGQGGGGGAGGCAGVNKGKR